MDVKYLFVVLTLAIKYFGRNSDHVTDVIPTCIYFVLMLVSKARKRNS